MRQKSPARTDVEVGARGPRRPWRRDKPLVPREVKADERGALPHTVDQPASAEVSPESALNLTNSVMGYAALNFG
jgi:hypothetical protein